MVGSEVGEGILAPNLQRGRMEVLATRASTCAQAGKEEQRRNEETVGEEYWTPFFSFLTGSISCDFFLKHAWRGNQLLSESSDGNEVRGQKATEGTDSQSSRDPRKQCKVKLG